MEIHMYNGTQEHRRRFLRTAMTIAAGELSMIGSLQAQPSQGPRDAANATAPSSFGPIKQIQAGPLSIGYAEMGPIGGRPVILLHGWPYDIHSFAEVGPMLAAAGYRVLAPYVRGFGSTRFIS